MKWSCSKNAHHLTYQCHRRQPLSCVKCDEEAQHEQERRQRDHELNLQRQRNQDIYRVRLKEIEDEIAHERRIMTDKAQQRQREDVLRQRNADLAAVKAASKLAMSAPKDRKLSPGHKVSGANATPEVVQNSEPDQALLRGDVDNDESAVAEWQYCKDYEGAENGALDELMKMIGLEEIKKEVMSIKAKIDTTVRQGVDLQDSRFGATLLGNPGTGMQLRF
jgi:hypothetical protein